MTRLPATPTRLQEKGQITYIGEAYAKRGEEPGIFNLDVLGFGDQIQIAYRPPDAQTDAEEIYLILTALGDAGRYPHNNISKPMAFRVDHLTQSAYGYLPFDGRDQDIDGNFTVAIIGSVDGDEIYPGRIVSDKPILLRTPKGFYETWPINRVAALRNARAHEGELESIAAVLPNQIKLLEKYSGMETIAQLEELSAVAGRSITQFCASMGREVNDTAEEFILSLEPSVGILTTQVRGTVRKIEDQIVTDLNEVIIVTDKKGVYVLRNVGLKYSGETTWQIARKRTIENDCKPRVVYTISNNPLSSGRFILNLEQFDKWKRVVTAQKLSGLAFTAVFNGYVHDASFMPQFQTEEEQEQADAVGEHLWELYGVGISDEYLLFYIAADSNPDKQPFHEYPVIPRRSDLMAIRKALTSEVDAVGFA